MGMKKNVAIYRGLAAAMAVCTTLSMTATTLTFQYDSMINKALGISTTVKTETEDGSGDTIYWSNEYGYDDNALVDVYRDAAAANVQIGAESAVLLKNENSALPMAQGTKMTIFGYAATSSKIFNTSTASYMTAKTFTEAMQDEFGAENVNTKVCDDVYSTMDTGGGGFAMMMSGATTITEGDIEEVKKCESSWANDYNDAAIVVFGRSASEGNDLYQYSDTDTYEDGSARRILDLSSDEEALISYLSEQKKAGVFGKIIVLVAGDFDLEMGFLDEYDVDACVFAGNEGSYGVEGLVQVLGGEECPSGRLVDTIASNSTSAPATVYAGHEGTQKWTNSDEINEANPLVNDSDGDHIDYYNIYAEGIYTGYKYYETRYEDVVMNEGGADSSVGSSTGSSWNYEDEMDYTFGYGLSYTSFEETLDSVTYDEESDNYILNVTVTNTGDVAGKDVVEVYAQTPYGDYEKENLVEKSSVSLMNFDKTQTLEPGASETLTIEVPKYFLASYDTNGAAGYILSEGDYYFTIGTDAHDAINNILAAKGYTTADGMTADGDASKTYTWAQDSLDTETYKNSPYTDVEVTNQFDDADINYYGYDFTYLTRQDWEGTYPAEAVVLEATDAVIETLSNYDYETPEDAPDYDSFTQGADNGLTLTDMLDVDINDDEAWDQFIDQMTVEEMANLMTDNLSTQVVTRLDIVGGSRCDDDTAAGGSIQWNSHPNTARTWNDELFEARGTIEGVTAQLNDRDEIWWGAANLHRTPFGGRANQYYSEDATFDYWMGYKECAAMQATGAIVCVKHFCTNDQETYRTGLSTFLTEQALRETYARAFEGSFQGGALSTMCALNRIGTKLAKNNYSLITTVLRDEWGFTGHVTSDGYVDLGYFNNAVDELVAGMDYGCCDSNGFNASLVLSTLDETKDGYLLQCLRTAAKRNCYVMLHSWRINGMGNGSTVTNIVPAWEIALMAANGIFALLFIIFTILSIVGITKGKKDEIRVEEA